MAKIYFVVHPKAEPPYGWAKIRSRITIPWNTTKRHHRKYIKRRGEYLLNGKRTEADLYFWGEYEPMTKALFVSRPNAPKAIHDVLYPVRGTASIPENALNTDPYVFGNHFKNICCGIPKGGDEEKAVYKHGDVIIFGNIEEDFFFFDTVFVVDRRIRINYYLNKTQYYKVSIEPYNLVRENEVKYYYQGVSYIENSEFYSFVPCSLNYSQKKPKLKLSDFGSKVYKQGFQAKAQAVDYDQKYWPIILKAVKDVEWEIGVYIDKI